MLPFSWKPSKKATSPPNLARPKLQRSSSIKQWLDTRVGALKRRLSTEKRREAALEKVREKTKENRPPEQDFAMPYSDGIHVPVPETRRAAGPLGDITDLYHQATANDAREEDEISFDTRTVSTPAEFESVFEDDRSFQFSPYITERPLRSVRERCPTPAYGMFDASLTSLALS
ncbi:hypothetical protein PsYK624_150420 [Phanerochaete sordida]|uniref:Uncharacterized protein n=1 Tax=Phanerochaete sordida TaxID=48140 RepID=A0A9P3GSP6_9APHY|nr:hypothetical protein PsYK624_150420 [Phanerochaete sordida]